jgi:23S rRNA pseudouridine2605 synthase
MSEKSKTSDETSAPDKKAERGERIAKVMGRLGLCSRRDAEKLIIDGRVTVNGVKITKPATFVKPEDNISVDGAITPRKAPPRLFLYHKPPGLITTAKDPQGRPTVFDILPKNLPRLISVGRLDINSEGLLLLTNDGELSRALELPATGLSRVYRVRVHGNVREDKIKRLEKGLTWKGVRYGPMKVALEKKQEGANVWMIVELKEGKNREIRNVMEAVDLQVNRLIRLSYGPFGLGKIPRGAMMEVKEDILRTKLPKVVVAELFD